MRRSSLVALLAALGSGLAYGSVVVRLDLPGLVRRAEAVFEGKCLSTRPVLDGAGNVATAVTVRISRSFKGVPTGADVEFRIPGGERGEVGLLIPGMPGFAPGEEILVFLTPESWTGIRMPVGLGQGKFRVETDARTGEKKLARSLGGLDLVDPATGAPLVSPGEEGFDYVAFTAVVDRLVRQGR